jgi:hypothetical protein
VEGKKRIAYRFSLMKENKRDNFEEGERTERGKEDESAEDSSAEGSSVACDACA